MADDGDTEVLEVIRRKVRQNLAVDFVVAKLRLVLSKAEISQPPPKCPLSRVPLGIVELSTSPPKVSIDHSKPAPACACSPFRQRSRMSAIPHGLNRSRGRRPSGSARELDWMSG